MSWPQEAERHYIEAIRETLWQPHSPLRSSAILAYGGFLFNVRENATVLRLFLLQGFI